MMDIKNFGSIKLERMWETITVLRSGELVLRIERPLNFRLKKAMYSAKTTNTTYQEPDTP